MLFTTINYYILNMNWTLKRFLLYLQSTSISYHLQLEYVFKDQSMYSVVAEGQYLLWRLAQVSPTKHMRLIPINPSGIIPPWKRDGNHQNEALPFPSLFQPYRQPQHPVIPWCFIMVYGEVNFFQKHLHCSLRLLKQLHGLYQGFIRTVCLISGALGTIHGSCRL